VLIPPDKPIGTGSAQEWDRIEARLGTRLPSDYKEFVGMYGAGWIAVPGDEFSVINPFAGWRRRRLEREIANQRAAHASLLEIYGRFGDVPEQPDGLIPWGTNSFRGVCFWEPNSADPDRWTVHSELDDDRMSYPENMTTYLLNVFRGAHDYFIYNVERSELRVPMPFTPARVPREVTVRWLRCNARALSRRPSSRTQASPSRSSHTGRPLPRPTGPARCRRRTGRRGRRVGGRHARRPPGPTGAVRGRRAFAIGP
jgi:hypothetical protein